MFARIPLPLSGLLALATGTWLLTQYPITVGWFGWVGGDAAEIDITAQISLITQLGLFLLVVGGGLLGASLGFVVGRRERRQSPPQPVSSQT
ncbi:MAG: hypothetical protein RJQ01_05500 [Microcella sp.]|uniref:hypothetical protein n=1 Tax=Microcella sp. TaxID=1913979 RepID=UPI00331472C8